RDHLPRGAAAGTLVVPLHRHHAVVRAAGDRAAGGVVVFLALAHGLLEGDDPVAAVALGERARGGRHVAGQRHVVAGGVGAVRAHGLEDGVGLHDRLAAFQRSLRATQGQRLHGGDAEEPDRDDDHRHQHLDQADAAHAAGAGGDRLQAAAAGSGRARGHQQPPPPLARVVTIVPLNITVMILWFSVGVSVGTQTVSCCWPSMRPDGRKAMPGAPGPATWTEDEPLASRMTSAAPVTLSVPVMIQRDQSAPQVAPSVVPHMVTVDPRRRASDRASCSEAVSSPVVPASRLLLISPTMGGTATAARMPRTATVTMSSTSVTPASSRRPGLARACDASPVWTPYAGRRRRPGCSRSGRSVRWGTWVATLPSAPARHDRPDGTTPPGPGRHQAPPAGRALGSGDDHPDHPRRRGAGP